jgi:acetyltransferase
VQLQILTADEIRTKARRALCELLIDAVSGGASVGWVAVPNKLEASTYWDSVADQVHRGGVVVLIAKEASDVIGTVQLHLSGRPNGAHRAEVARLLVYSRARRRGVGAALMAAIEEEALLRRISLLVLDTRTGDPSQHLYEKIGYTLAGIIPRYARGTTGTLEPTSIMYKEIKELGQDNIEQRPGDDCPQPPLAPASGCSSGLAFGAGALNQDAFERR